MLDFVPLETLLIFYSTVMRHIIGLENAGHVGTVAHTFS
jgi:hypothetical protein